MIDFAAFVHACKRHVPGVFLVLGSGLGEISDRVEPIAQIAFSHIPKLPLSSISGHRGRWTLGRWGGRVVLVSEGRIHYYEGHDWPTVTRPIRLAAELGVRFAILTNAAGGIRDDLEPGSLMPIRDHLQWNQPTPWRGSVEPSPYAPDLLEIIERIGGCQPAGVYGAVCGPSYETPAEIRALRSMGADAVGMSTSREAIAGNESGLKCCALSMITNRAAGLSTSRLDHQEVLMEGRAAAGRLGDLLEQIVRRL